MQLAHRNSVGVVRWEAALRAIETTQLEQLSQQLRHLRRSHWINAMVDCPVNLINSVSLLHAAAERGWLAGVRRLLGSGGQVDLVDAQGCTPLHRAAGLGHADVVSALLLAGADARRMVPGRGTALDMALAGGHRHAAWRLLAHDGKRWASGDVQARLHAPAIAGAWPVAQTA